MTDPCLVCGVPDGEPHLATMGDPYRNAVAHIVVATRLPAAPTDINLTITVGK